ncbi:MAG: Colanic acid exporter [uncultured Sulfurovum sp.]|uniref:Colanic acid exporter n=1 Tax=uncultured Sulfurovum sp. TaxID=269237 RepID=A0A6S6TSV7_9BACT|nr:MAG: Colanic acid exporter [uncultured Sulfurovum sp.]
MTLKKRVFGGVKWVAFANIAQQVVSLIGIIVFAKLLSPEDFGTFSILMVFVGFLIIFSDLGISAALIHFENASEELLSSMFFFNVFIGFTLALLLILSAEPIAKFFDSVQLKPLLQITALNFIIISFSIVQKAILQKNIDFKYLSLINSFSLLVGLVVGIGAAYYGYGVYSLVIQVIIASLLTSVLIWYYSQWRPKWYFSFGEIKKIWKYTSNLSLFNIINYFSKNADNFLIGKYLSMSALGVYSIAYKIMLYPIQNITNILIHVLFPAFAKLQEDNERFKKAYLQVIFYIALITFPLMIGLMTVADLLVNLLFEDKWTGLALLLFILAPVGMLRSILSTVGMIYMSKGSTDVQLKLGTVNAIVIIVGFLIGLQFGVVGVAVSYFVSHIIMFYPVLKISWKQIDLDVYEGLAKIMPVLIISMMMGASIYLFEVLWFVEIANHFLRLLVMLTVGTLLYLGMIRIRYGSLRTLIRSVKS